MTDRIAISTRGSGRQHLTGTMMISSVGAPGSLLTTTTIITLGALPPSVIGAMNATPAQARITVAGMRGFLGGVSASGRFVQLSSLSERCSDSLPVG